MASLSSGESGAHKIVFRGKYCVAGAPNNLSCKNNSSTEGIFMHTFPKEGPFREKWTRFVRRHRPNWQPSKKSTLCSVHFEQHFFEQRPDISLDGGEKFRTRRWLKRNEAVPSIDAIEVLQQAQSARERRKVNASNVNIK